jgi:hypothetical protein
VTANAGLITGGDSRSFYVGNYTLDGPHVFVELRIRRHNQRVILPSVVGATQATIQIDGRFEGSRARLTGFALAKMPIKIEVVIDRLMSEGELDSHRAPSTLTGRPRHSSPG